MSFTKNEKIALLKALEEKENRIKFNKLASYNPYPKQREFHAAGRGYNERCLGAGNQLGKTLCASMEVAIHATGLYPDWWNGKRIDKPNVGWVGGETSETIRDTSQKLLIGRIENENEVGAGSIPKNCIIGYQFARGVPNALDHIKVKHVSGGISLIFFKAYQKGRAKFQGDTIDWIWFDEEPDYDIYSEGKTRTNANGICTMLTFTPLLGMTELATQFYESPASGQYLVLMTIDDVDHYSEEEKQKIINSYKAHELEARTRGIPVMGSGLVFQISDHEIEEEPIIEVPRHWARINGLDIGGSDHPTAATHLLYDRDADCIHVHLEYAENNQDGKSSMNHAYAIKAWGNWLTAWPHDALQHDKGSGQQIAKQYREHGLNMLPAHATFPDGSNGVEAGLSEMLERMKTGRWKVSRLCKKWFAEKRLYHRKDGKLVKLNDDVISSSRYALMMLRFAKSEVELKKTIISKPIPIVNRMS